MKVQAIKRRYKDVLYVVIPASICEKLGIRKSDNLFFSVKSGKIEIEKV